MKPSTSNKQKDYGYADHEFTCELIEQGLSDEDACKRLINERKFSREKAARFVEQAKRAKNRRPTAGDRSNAVLGVVLILFGIAAVAGGVTTGISLLFWLGIVCVFGGGLQLSPKLDIRK